MKKLILILCVLITGIFTSCVIVEDDTYWCEYHRCYHTYYRDCCRLKYCNWHGGWYDYPDHWRSWH